MNIFNDSFLNQLSLGITQIVTDAVKRLVEKEKPVSQRYLNKKEARAYLGGMDPAEFDTLVSMGLKVVTLTRPSGQTSTRYDIEDLDEFMAAYKV